MFAKLKQLGKFDDLIALLYRRKNQHYPLTFLQEYLCLILLYWTSVF